MSKNDGGNGKDKTPRPKPVQSFTITFYDNNTYSIDGTTQNLSIFFMMLCNAGIIMINEQQGKSQAAPESKHIILPTGLRVPK